MGNIHFDERYSVHCNPFASPPGDNRMRLRRLRHYLPEAMEDLTERQKKMVALSHYN